MQEPWHPDNASCDSFRKLGKAEAVKKNVRGNIEGVRRHSG